MRLPPWRSWFNRWPQLDERSSSLLTLLFSFLSLWLVGLHHAYSPFRLHIVCATFMGCYTRKELMKDLNPAAWLVPDLHWAPSACFGQTVKSWGDTQTWCPSVRPELARRCSVGVSLRTHRTGSSVIGTLISSQTANSHWACATDVKESAETVVNIIQHDPFGSG